MIQNDVAVHNGVSAREAFHQILAVILGKNTIITKILIILFHCTHHHAFIMYLHLLL